MRNEIKYDTPNNENFTQSGIYIRSNIFWKDINDCTYIQDKNIPNVTYQWETV